MNANHHESSDLTRTRITLRGPAELADALPFVLGFHPTDSVVLVALHGEHGRFGGRVRLGIPSSPSEWASTADHLAECLVEGSSRSGTRPDGIVVFLCQDPAAGETGRRVMERLRPFAQRLRTACGALDIPVYEALCISDGLFFSYCCPDARCCPPDGTPLALSGTSVMAATAAYAGVQVRGSLRDMERRFQPAGGPREEEQRAALDASAAEIVPRILEDAEGKGRDEVRETTLRLARQVLRRFVNPPGEAGPTGRTAGSTAPRTVRAGIAGTAESDAADDALVETGEAAALILGLQDRATRDRAAEWMEGWEGAAALRLWRVLARRCVAPYQEHAAAPLTLAGWTAWSAGDEPTARVALGLALDIDPEYVFARLLHQACNEGLDPESLRSCLRAERDSRIASDETASGTSLQVRTRVAHPRSSRQTLRKPGRQTRGAERRSAAGVRPAGPAAGKPGSGSPRRGGRRDTRSGR
ncbi:DUF4192 domain-containing protein [Streptomyces flavochromogenes]|uniref:DUF4192 domain-containing protein n=1 Tax=Streptomyces flavochromogenes TaxID=68199 RepID=A0ABW6XU79_9ACTN|nr:DUF4192 domain-containing protein [Streptomyces flavochromogenes]